MKPILILGGYGNFGGRIARALTQKNLAVAIAGRREDKARAFARTLPADLVSIEIFDIERDLDDRLQKIGPCVVVNTCGPFQARDYNVARCCIRHGVHYIDLADGRDFVVGISALDAEAQAAGVALIGGASTVPGLSSAVLEHFRPEFSKIDSLVYGIAPGQRAERGLATTQGVLSYVGKALRPCAGAQNPIYGWQDIYRQNYPGLGKRWMANCDIPDLDLLPKAYGLKSIRFSAGLELAPLHLGLWALSWAVRAGLPINLPRYARIMLRAADFFDALGSADGGMHMLLRGADVSQQAYERHWFVIARNGDGPQIPTIPAIILAQRLAEGKLEFRGALACVGLVKLEDYLAELAPFAVSTESFVNFPGDPA